MTDTSTEESRYLLQIAQQEAAARATNPNVAAILLTGSVAKGTSDRYSDIDIILYYHEPPTEADFEAICEAVKATGGGMHGGDAASGFAVYAYLEGHIRCDFAHSSLTAWEQSVAAVLERYEADSPMQKVLAGVVEGVPLYGEAVIATLKAKASQYPDQLARNMVSRHLSFWPSDLMRKMMAGRGDRLWFQDSMVEAQKKLLGILMGLNRRYHWGEYKRLDKLAASLSIAPPDFTARLQDTLTAAPDEALDTLVALLHETLALVETHLPDVDIFPVRRRLNSPLTPWEIVEA